MIENRSTTIVRLLIFLFIFTLLFSYVSKVFNRKWGLEPQTTLFYEQPEDTIDVLFFGASGIWTGASPLTMWKEAGFTSYVRAVGAQQSPMTYYYFLESLEYQIPEIVVLDAYLLVRLASFENNEGVYRMSYEPLKFSLYKLRALFDITSESSIESFFQLLFPLLRYHTRWSELEQNDFEYYKNIKTNNFKGQYESFTKFPAKLTDDFMAPTEDFHPISEVSLSYFEKILEKCEEYGIEVVLLSMPRLSTANYSQYNTVKQYSEDYGLLFIDYNLPELMEEVNFDPTTDMKDEGHVNMLGAEKFSKHFAAFLTEHFNLCDKRQNPAFIQWNTDAKYLYKLIEQNRE